MSFLFLFLFAQLTETSARYARKISGTTALQEALKEKQQHIEQLLAERDLERCEVAKATSHAGEVQQELALLRKGRDQVCVTPTPPNITKSLFDLIDIYLLF